MKLKSGHIAYLVAGSVIIYFYLKNREGKADGKISGFKVNPHVLVDSALPWLNINGIYKPIIGTIAKSALSGIVGEAYDGETIDAKYRRLS
jgi:hypothetical protein